MPRLLSFAACLLAALALRAETFDLDWPTRHGAPPPERNLTPEQQKWLPAFRASLGWLNEPAILTLALGQSPVFGVPPETGDRIAALVATRYEAIAQDPEFSNAPSHLAYCYSATRPSMGLARVTTPAPDKIATAPVILFVHGQGGSFLWYQHWLRSVFPEHIIISPAHGIFPGMVSPEYLLESLAAAEKRLGRRIEAPTLIGLSAGGFGVLRAAGRDPKRYDRTIVLAAFADPAGGVSNGWHGRSYHFIAGAGEYFVQDGTLRRGADLLRRCGARAEIQTIAGADHFFALTHPEETAAALRRAALSPRADAP